MLQGSLSAVSSAATLDLVIEVRDEETNDLIDLSGLSIEFQASPINNWPMSAIADDTILSLTASTDEGTIAVIGTGTLEILIPSTTMRSTPNGAYDVGLTLKDPADDDYVVQVYLGQMNLLPGIVRNP